jgi:FixJ family two-component response regulator
MDENQIVFVVDDDQAIREGISDLVESMGMEVQCFASAEEFEQSYEPGRPNCLLLDVRMPGMSGMELLTRLAQEEIYIPTIIVTGHGDISIAVEALKTGAVDFIEKPFRGHDLWLKIKEAFAVGAASRDKQSRRADLKSKLSLLTSKERGVLRLLVTGRTDKQVAVELDISRRAVAFHRARILGKIAPLSIIESTALLARLDISL